MCVSQREGRNEILKKNQKKITQIVSPLPSPAAETLRRAHMSHALVTAVRDGEMCR